MSFVFSILRIILFLVFAVVVLVFTLSNNALVPLSLYPLPIAFDVPLYAIGLGGFALGVILGGGMIYASHIMSIAKNKIKTLKNDRKLKALEDEIKALRVEQRLYKQHKQEKSATKVIDLLPQASTQSDAAEKNVTLKNNTA